MSETSDHPDVQWALDILAPDARHEPNMYSKYIWEICGTAGGFGYACLYNLVHKRPVFTYIPKHILCTAIGLGIGIVGSKITYDIRSKRDAVLRDYIIRHPEDFPVPVRKKWSEVFEPWSPIR